MKPELKFVVDIAIAAGLEILDVYNARSPIAVELKADDSPITAADRRAHDAIVAGLNALSPQLPVLSEESTLAAFDIRKSWPRYWLVDPLDGTKEFISRNGEFSVNIALIEDGEAVLGVVHMPVLGVTYYGQKGVGAAKRDQQGKHKPIQCRKVGRAVRVVASRHHRSDQVDSVVRAITTALGKPELVSMGSSLKMCLLAEGEADIYPRFGPTCEWDTAAAHAILKAAGGDLLDLNFNALRYNQKAELLNPSFIGIGDTAYPWRALLEKALS
jgi:3'(2'), 5'-bisphosphate nucleotidase